MPKQGSKSGKSSKTARVLNLLTDPEAVEDSAGQSDAVESAADSAKLADDRRTQAKIRGALEQELAATAAPARPTRARPTRGAPAEEAKPASSAREAVPVEMPAFTDEDGGDEAAPEPVFPIPERPKAPMETAVSELRTAGESAPDEYICFNVTQALVEDKADKYIKMFGLCGCSRCRIDVIALALSNLPAKYVVAKPDELIPRLSMYEQKYNAAVVTQVMSACKKVLDRPHHVREQD